MVWFGFIFNLRVTSQDGFHRQDTPEAWGGECRWVAMSWPELPEPRSWPGPPQTGSQLSSPGGSLGEVFCCGSSEGRVALDKSQPLEPKGPRASCVRVKQVLPQWASNCLAHLLLPAAPHWGLCPAVLSKAPPQRFHPGRPSASSWELLRNIFFCKEMQDLILFCCWFSFCCWFLGFVLL